MNKKIAIIGAGISGLSCAYMLAPEYPDITIIAKAFSPDITSNRAAAFWFPYHIRNDQRGIAWCKISYRVYQQFASDVRSGISMKQLIKVVRKGISEEEPVWIEFMPDGAFREIGPPELDNRYQKGYHITVPLIETQIFLPYLQQKLSGMGISFVEQEISDFSELQQDFDCIINCTALGSRELCNDASVIPVRGQVVLIAPGEQHFLYLDNEMPLYVVPRKDAIILGGTYEEGISEETTEPAALAGILENAYAVFPEFRKHAILGSWAGIRPFRSQVRLEKGQAGNIIHNYGHGGSGFTLAFGCASEVKKLIQEF